MDGSPGDGREVLVAKRLRQSELGWFEACRLAGRETARQRALNLDSDIVRAIFAPGDNDVQIDVQERWWDGERLVDDRRPIKLQQKNWRLAGNAVTGARFDTVQPDDIVLMLFEQSAPAALWSLTWDVLSQVERATASVFEMARDVLGGHSSVCVPADVQASLLAAARRRLPAFGGDPNTDTADLSDEDWENVIAWLHDHLTIPKMRTMLRDEHEEDVRWIVKALGTRESEQKRDTAQDLLRRFGTDLLASKTRRAWIAKARFPSGSQRPVEPGRWQRGGPAALR